MSPECRDLVDRLLTSDIRQRLGHRGAGEARPSLAEAPCPLAHAVRASAAAFFIAGVSA